MTFIVLFVELLLWIILGWVFGFALRYVVFGGDSFV